MGTSYNFATVQASAKALRTSGSSLREIEKQLGVSTYELKRMLQGVALTKTQRTTALNRAKAAVRFG